MYGIVYKITNTINGMAYIGMTTRSLKTRWQNHHHCASWKPKSQFHLAIIEHGREAFNAEKIGEADTHQELVQLEKQLIEEHKTRAPFGYNLIDGGSGELRRPRNGRPRGFHMSEESKRKMSATKRGQKLSPEHIAAIAAGQLGRKASESTRKKLSEADRRRDSNKELIARRAEAIRRAFARKRALRAAN